MRLPPFKAVILDLDGLILDTESTYWRAWQEAAEQLGFELQPELLQQLSGQSIDQVNHILCSHFGRHFDFPEFHELSTRLWHQWVTHHGIGLQPGYDSLTAVLQRLDIPHLLATNSQRRYAEKCLQLAGIPDHFPEFISRDDVSLGKPAPDIYLRATEILSIPPEQCLAVEDSYPGILSASRARVLPVLIPGAGRMPKEVTALLEGRFDRLDELAEAMERSYQPNRS